MTSSATSPGARVSFRARGRVVLQPYQLTETTTTESHIAARIGFWLG